MNVNDCVPVVISGMAGRFPDSNSVNEFAENLYANVDMVTVDDRRWPTDLYEMAQGMGKLKDLDLFDGAFFGLGNMLGDAIDPGARLLLETVYEAIADGGVNPATLRGSSTGVYVGSSTIGMADGLPPTVDPTSRYSLTESMARLQGNGKSLYSNRVSFHFDFRGPSMTIDTACSSSMVALDVAVTDLRSGKVDQAIVAGLQVNLQAFTNYLYQKLGLNAPDGLSKVWDEEADGFVRGETVAALFLQRHPDAKRVYARILHSRTAIDGYKTTGMFFPSSDSQFELLKKVYQEAGVSPNDLTYFEAHGTGTKAGDYQEAYAIHRAYCSDGRTEKLPIGLLKSSVGHGEGASGVASITKAILAFETGRIPGNLHLKNLKANIAQLELLQPITENLPYTPGIAGVNSFGVGGVNGHALLEPNYKTPTSGNEVASVSLPRLVLLHGRTKEGVEFLMDYLEGNPGKVTADFLGLIADVFKSTPILHSAGFPFRGSMLIKGESNDGETKLKFTRNEIQPTNLQFRSQLAFFYSGIGGQTVPLAKELMSLPEFSNQLKKCALILAPFNVDLVKLLTDDSSVALLDSSLVAKFVSTTAFQVIMTDLLMNHFEIAPERIVGHSFGEISAAYAQGYISSEEALLIAYHRGVALEEARSDIPIGLMAAVGLSAVEASEQCPEGVFLACINAPKLVTLSGEIKAMKAFLEKLSSRDVFVRELESAAYPLHTPYLEVIQERLRQRLESVFASTRRAKMNQRLNSDSLKWISTCQTGKTMEELHSCQKEDGLQFQDRLVTYFIENLLKPVNLTGALSHLADSTIVLEIAGQELFEKVISRASEPSLKYQALFKRSTRHPEGLLASLATLYGAGFNPAIEKLYPAVEWPVARGTASISSLLKWDHSRCYAVKSYEHFFKASASDLLIELDLENPEYDFLLDHIIDGRAILPGTAMLFFAWKRYAESHGRPWTKLPVEFEQVQLRRPVFLSREVKTRGHNLPVNAQKFLPVKICHIYR